MSTTTEILRCFMAMLDDFVCTPQPEILWPGIKKDPPEEGFWLEPKLFPNRPVDDTWSEGCVEVRGTLSVLVYYRVTPDLGQLEPSRLADAIIAHFPKETEITDGVRVRQDPWQSPAIDDGDRSYIPVTVPYLGTT